MQYRPWGLVGAAALLVLLVAGVLFLRPNLSGGPTNEARPTETGLATASPNGTTATINPGGTTATPTAKPTPTPKPTITPSGLVGVWQALGSVREGVIGDTAWQLFNGRVVVFSTAGSNRIATTRSWSIDVDTGAVQAGPAMAYSQRIPSVAPMDDGSLLVVGGWHNADPVVSVEILDATTGRWTANAPMLTPRSQATVTNLGAGRFLVAGGWVRHNSDGGWSATASAEVYDVTSNTWTYTGSLNTPRALATATRLRDGRVLVVGGDRAWVGSTGESVLASAEIYDPGSGTWSSAGRMAYPRAAHSAVLLPDGRVMVSGGWMDGLERGMPTVEIYDPASQGSLPAWSATGWSQVSDMPHARAQARTVALPDGRFMMIGGLDGTGVATSSVDLLDPSNLNWVRTGPLNAPAYWPAAVVLSDGRVLAIGGGKGSSTTRSIQVIEPPSR